MTIKIIHSKKLHNCNHNALEKTVTRKSAFVSNTSNNTYSSHFIIPLQSKRNKKKKKRGVLRGYVNTCSNCTQSDWAIISHLCSKFPFPPHVHSIDKCNINRSKTFLVVFQSSSFCCCILDCHPVEKTVNSLCRAPKEKPCYSPADAPLFSKEIPVGGLL